LAYISTRTTLAETTWLFTCMLHFFPWIELLSRLVPVATRPVVPSLHVAIFFFVHDLFLFEEWATSPTPDWPFFWQAETHPTLFHRFILSALCSISDKRNILQQKKRAIAHATYLPWQKNSLCPNIVTKENLVPGNRKSVCPKHDQVPFRNMGPSSPWFAWEFDLFSSNPCIRQECREAALPGNL
jgi:hypothetical protein